MRRLTILALTGALMAAGPVATAPAQTGDSRSEQRSDDTDFPWGLLGLLGLAGLAGLKRRDDDRHTRATTPRSPTR